MGETFDSEGTDSNNHNGPDNGKKNYLSFLQWRASRHTINSEEYRDAVLRIRQYIHETNKEPKFKPILIDESDLNVAAKSKKILEILIRMS